MIVCRVVLLAFIGLNLVVSIAKHGEDRPKYDMQSAYIAFWINMCLFWGAGLFEGVL